MSVVSVALHIRCWHRTRDAKDRFCCAHLRVSGRVDCNVLNIAPQPTDGQLRSHYNTVRSLTRELCYAKRTPDSENMKNRYMRMRSIKVYFQENNVFDDLLMIWGLEVQNSNST